MNHEPSKLGRRCARISTLFLESTSFPARNDLQQQQQQQRRAEDR